MSSLRSRDQSEACSKGKTLGISGRGSGAIKWELPANRDDKLKTLVYDFLRRILGGATDSGSPIIHRMKKTDDCTLALKGPSKVARAPICLEQSSAHKLSKKIDLKKIFFKCKRFFLTVFTSMALQTYF